jgi:hypothetical protein
MGDTTLNDDLVQEIVAKLENKELPIQEVKALYDSHKDNKIIVGQVAMNLSLRTSVYDRDQEYSEEMVALLSDIATNPVDMGARWAVAKNPHTPISVLELLAKDDVNLVRALVATNPSTPTAVLDKFFSDEKIVKDGLSGNPNTSEKLLKILADDADKMVRLRLAENPSISTELLEKLSKDLDPNVSKAAQIHLEKRS